MKNLLYYLKYLVTLLIFLSFSQVWGQQSIAHTKKNTLEKTETQLNQKPVAKIKQLDKVRFCDSGTLNAVSINPNAIYKWVLNGVTIGKETSISVSESGVYTLQVTLNEYQTTTQIEVFVLSTPQKPIVETNQTTISIQNVEYDAIYQWFRNGKLLKETVTSISVSIEGNYQVRVASAGNTTCNSFSEVLQINPSELTLINLKVSKDKKTIFLEIVTNSQNEIANTEQSFEEEITSDSFKIYPNPSKGTFNINFGTVLSEDMQVSIFTPTGQVISTQIFEKGNQDFSIDLHKLDKGLYLIRFNQNNSTYSKSILME